MSNLRPIHPFPARMAPEIALEECRTLADSAVVLDPMSGSGTVLRVAAEMGRRSIGCDLDPLAVLISSAWSSQVSPEDIVPAARELVARAQSLTEAEIELPWLGDIETTAFTAYWFAKEQRDALARLGACLLGTESSLADVLRVCLSRLIITKERGASLARDVSHSRPHKVRDTNDFSVMSEFVRSAEVISRHLSVAPVLTPASVSLSDARRIGHLEDASIDAVITSPPYLNAIDYMRGHKLSLIWLGYSIPALRAIRSASVGSERYPDPSEGNCPIYPVVAELPWFGRLPRRQAGLVLRYAGDMLKLATEIFRLLKQGGRAVLVVGNSCLRGVYIENSHILEIAARHLGFSCSGVYTRDLPASRRYLPTPSAMSPDDLAKRMRKECILTFTKA